MEVDVDRKGRKFLKGYLDTEEPVLEIGPMIRPFIKRENYNVFYADINDTASVCKLYANENYEAQGFLSQKDFFEAFTPIDFVVKGTYKEAVKDISFQSVFSSHVIEHTVDIISHICQVSECIKESGYLLLAVPDKRYTFDHYREVTPFRDAIDIHLSGGDRARFAFDEAYNAHHNYAMGYHEKRDLLIGKTVWEDRYKLAKEQYDAVKSGKDFFGHTWVFTYISFLTFLRDGIRSGFFPFSLEFSSEPQYGENEMCIALKKNSKILSCPVEKKKELTHIQRILDDYEGILPPIGWGSSELKEKVFIYGAGASGRRVFSARKGYGVVNIAGFVVSDGQEKNEFVLGLPVLYLSEILPIKDECSIIIASYAKEEIAVQLEKYGIDYKISCGL